ncbi:hypothetical protein BKA58DRAFT_60819 [Alternaria rosae]|uniref:uncharacterized protein n=1 Tax=Alternaria rosae TaxID=1187941 RepID=UPI001E8D033D|nr:uncharacterized protein BKA58DRAFT_60819 [Alternaria rosae]KAH6852856.1 hypothetical protein BKA58DRAFT_60819 [Alternaria rosae]
MWRMMIAVAKALDRRGLLEQRFDLAHGDLFPRNIIAEITDPATVKITGIVDWDMAYLAPKFMALRPPFWAWVGDSMGERDEDVVTYEPPIEKYEALKRTFRSAALAKFIKFGLSRESAIARKPFKVVTGGLLGTDRRCLALQLAEQRDTLYPEDELEHLGAECWSRVDLRDVHLIVLITPLANRQPYDLLPS